MIRSNAGRCPVSAQCRILGVAKSTCYWVLEHPEAERADPYEKDVERVWRDSGKVYGARKIRHALEHDLGGCGRFLGDRTERFSYVQS